MDGESKKVQADMRSRSPSEEPADLPSGIPDNINVVCGDARGVLDLKTARVLYQGEDISPTELEKIGGRGASKKWKTSLRIVNAEGKSGPTVGDWLQSHGFDIKNSKLVPYTAKLSPPPSHPQRPGIIIRPPVAKPPPVKAPPAVKLHRPSPALKPLLAPSVDLFVHLQSQYIGYIPGDPTVEGVPDELPPSSLGSELTVIDLDKMSHEDLMEMSRASAPDPLGALLPIAPGILPEREAHLTGHQPAKRPRTMPSVDANQASASVGEYMAGQLANPPWQAFGLSRAPLICGRDLDLHLLYKAVQSHGGYDATISNKCWGKVATALGIDKSTHTNASFILRTTYFKFLLPYEMQARALNPRRPSKELQSDSKKAASESIDAPSGANVDDTLEQSSGTASEEDFIPLPQSEEPSQSPMEEDRGMMHTSDTPTLDAPGSAAEETAAAASRQGAIDGRPEAADGPAADLEPYAEAPASSAGIAEGKGCQEQFSKQGLSGADDLNRGADTIDFDGSESQEVIVIDDGHENVAS